MLQEQAMWNIPASVLKAPLEEFAEVRKHLKRRQVSDVPKVVDLYGAYGAAGALKTTKQLLEFFEFTKQTACKIVSIGD